MIDSTELGMMRFPHDCSPSEQIKRPDPFQTALDLRDVQAARLLSHHPLFPRDCKRLILPRRIRLETMVHKQTVASSICFTPRLFSGEFGGAVLAFPRKFLLRRKVHTKNQCRDVMLLGNTLETMGSCGWFSAD